MTLSPRRVGNSVAIAGRSMPGRVFSTNLAIAISAPVLPADTTPSARPSATASIASRMLDRRAGAQRQRRLGVVEHRPRRYGAARRLRQPRQLCSSGAILAFVAEQQEMGVGMPLAARYSAPRSDHRRRAVAAHRVEGDCGAVAHRARLWPSAAGQEVAAVSCVIDFAPAVMAAGRAQMVRPLQLAAIRALGIGRRAAARDASGACCGAKARFSFSGRP